MYSSAGWYHIFNIRYFVYSNITIQLNIGYNVALGYTWLKRWWNSCWEIFTSMIFRTEHGLEVATVKLPVLVLPNVMNGIAHVGFHSVTRQKICRSTKEIDLLDVRSNFVICGRNGRGPIIVSMWVKTLTSMKVLSYRPPQNPFAATSSRAPSDELAEAPIKGEMTGMGWRSGSILTSLQTSVRRRAVRSRISLCLIDGKPPQAWEGIQTNLEKKLLVRMTDQVGLWFGMVHHQQGHQFSCPLVRWNISFM